MISRLSYLRCAGFCAGFAVFLAGLAGCGNKRHVETPLEGPHLVEAEPVEPLRLAGPRSQAAIEECFSAAKNSTWTPRAHTPQPAPPDSLGPVTPEPGWDVALKASWKHIVVHHSASARGSAQIFHQAHLARGWDGLGYHFVIGNGEGSGDGEVEVGYRWTQQTRGAHAGNQEFNEHGIGICLVGNFEFERPTPRQMASLRKLVRFLQAKASIPASEVIGHKHVPGKDTKCPGRLFDLEGFRGSLGAAAAKR